MIFPGCGCATLLLLLLPSPAPGPIKPAELLASLVNVRPGVEHAEHPHAHLYVAESPFRSTVLCCICAAAVHTLSCLRDWALCAAAGVPAGTPPPKGTRFCLADCVAAGLLASFAHSPNAPPLSGASALPLNSCPLGLPIIREAAHAISASAGSKRPR